MNNLKVPVTVSSEKVHELSTISLWRPPLKLLYDRDNVGMVVLLVAALLRCEGSALTRVVTTASAGT